MIISHFARGSDRTQPSHSGFFTATAQTCLGVFLGTGKSFLPRPLHAEREEEEQGYSNAAPHRDKISRDFLCFLGIILHRLSIGPSLSCSHGPSSAFPLKLFLSQHTRTVLIKGTSLKTWCLEAGKSHSILFFQ